MHAFIDTAPYLFSESHFVGALVMAALLGAVLGVERSLAGKHAGMRTYALVSMGSCLFVVVGDACEHQPLVLLGD